MKAGLIIVVVALMGAILAGSIGFTQVPYTDTDYNRVSDLTPIVSADPVLADEQYNPTSNQVGWTNVTYVTQTQPSVYSFRNEGTFASFTTNSFWSYGGIYYTQNSAYSNGQYTPQGYTNVTVGLTWSDGSNGAYADGGRTIIGGYYDKSPVLIDTNNVEHYAECNVLWDDPWVTGGSEVRATTDMPLYWQSLNRIATANNWPSGIIVAGQNNYVEFMNMEPSFYKTSEGDRLVSYLFLHTHQFNDDKMYWNNETRSFYTITGYDELTGAPLYDATTGHTLYWIISDNDTTRTLTLERFIPGSVTYVTPYSPVSIASGNTATWSNGYDNSQVQLIVDPGATVTVGTTALTLPAMSSVYDKCLVTVGSSGCYWQGISAYVSPTNYNVFDYRYEFTGTVTTPITSLQVSGSSMAYVVNTWVPMDPRGLLWQDPSFNINQYFPDVTARGARVIFSSILTTGNSLTINGNTYNTSDRSIEIDGTSYRLDGLAVDYRIDGHVYLIPSGGPTIDLGGRSTYVISGAGVWYWSAEIDSITTVTKERTEILSGQSPDPAWMVFAFIGISILCLVAMAAIGRESMDGLDWAVVILSIIISLMLVV